MPSFEKSSPELIAFFHEALLAFPQAELRKTFGYPCAYIHGHMTTGLHQQNMFVHLSPEDETGFLRIPGAKSFAPMENRPMKGYVVLPGEMTSSTETARQWIQRAIDYTSSLPVKEKKAPRKKS